MLKQIYPKALIALVLTGLAVGVFFGIRHMAVQRIVHRLQAFADRHHAHLKMSDPHWRGFYTLLIDDLHLIRSQSELALQGLQMKLNPWKGNSLQAVELVTWDKLEVAHKQMAWEVEGKLQPANTSCDLRLKQTQGTHTPIQGLDLTLQVHPEQGPLRLHTHLKSLHLQHARIAPSPLQLKPTEVTLNLHLQGTAIRLGHNSKATIGQWHTNLGGGVELSSGQFNTWAQSPAQPFQHWLEALPSGMSTCISDLQTTGSLKASLALSFPLSHPADLHFNAALQDQDLKISAGDPGFEALRTQAHAPGLLDPTELPPPILRAILLSEDANFYAHKGFEAPIVEAALRDNLQQGRFVRGGGTLTMQLMRNTFLDQHKNLTRKVEETLLTLLAERSGQLSKHEILTLYLNQIEWGPNVHGIQEAAAFYFHTSPQKLSLDQGLFLAAIIPNPRHYRTLLNSDGGLGEFAQSYYDAMRWLLFEEGLVEEAELDKPYPTFHLPETV